MKWRTTGNRPRGCQNEQQEPGKLGVGNLQERVVQEDGIRVAAQIHEEIEKE